VHGRTRIPDDGREGPKRTPPSADGIRNDHLIQTRPPRPIPINVLIYMRTCKQALDRGPSPNPTGEDRRVRFKPGGSAVGGPRRHHPTMSRRAETPMKHTSSEGYNTSSPNKHATHCSGVVFYRIVGLATTNSKRSRNFSNNVLDRSKTLYYFFNSRFIREFKVCSEPVIFEDSGVTCQKHPAVWD
jgi:hypothetical protein